jgi:NadR type nicotinamide-nucleotide adenylyltransferase
VATEHDGVTKRVVLIGPESSGKTSIAAALSQAFGAPWTPEAAREFAAWSAVPLSADTVEPIARLSMAFENGARRGAPALLIRDTDLLSTIVYARHYYGDVAPWIVDEARTRLADLYLLCAPDLPWLADGIRDRPWARGQLLDEFRAVLKEFGASVVEISGHGPERTEMARRAVDQLVRRR